MEAEVDRLAGPGAADKLDFEALETALRRRVLALAARVVERDFNEDRSDHVGPRRPCPCGRRRAAGRHPKTFETVPLTLERGQGCHQGCFPRDQQLGLERTSLSPATVRMTGSAAALVSFAEASGLLAELAGVRVEAKQVERVAGGWGVRLRPPSVRGRSSPSRPPLRRCTSVWTAPACRCETERAGRASSPTGQPRRARPSWSCLDRRDAQPAGPPGARPGLGQLLGRDRERRQP